MNDNVYPRYEDLTVPTSSWKSLSFETFASDLAKPTSADTWESLGEERALKVFHEAARTIPAYADFLVKNAISVDKIKTIQDFVLVPETSKKNYISQYPMIDLIPSGDVTQIKLIASSSGTTGEPTYWPRGVAQSEESVLIHELFFTHAFQIHTRRTLAIIAFPFGVYVSGVATAEPLFTLAQKYPITVITAGLNREGILSIVREQGKYYDQILLIGHPFFIKDVLERGEETGVAWRSSEIRIMLCSEMVSEEWRDYILSLIGQTGNIGAVRNTYGSSELLLMGLETLDAIALRRNLDAQPQINQEIFQESIVPSIFQYHPLFRYIESKEKALLYTSWSGIPLIRYRIEDKGMVLPQKEFDRMRKQLNLDTVTTPNTEPSWSLPYLALFGRLDKTALFDGINIYPEHIHKSLNAPAFLPSITGKFVIDTRGEGPKLISYLRVNIELKEGILPTTNLAQSLAKHIKATLLDISLEYRFLTQQVRGDKEPKVILRKFQDPEFFPVGVKPRYIRS